MAWRLDICKANPDCADIYAQYSKDIDSALITDSEKASLNLQPPDSYEAFRRKCAPVELAINPYEQMLRLGGSAVGSAPQAASTPAAAPAPAVAETPAAPAESLLLRELDAGAESDADKKLVAAYRLLVDKKQVPNDQIPTKEIKQKGKTVLSKKQIASLNVIQKNGKNELRFKALEAKRAAELEQNAAKEKQSQEALQQANAKADAAKREADALKAAQSAPAPVQQASVPEVSRPSASPSGTTMKKNMSIEIRGGTAWLADAPLMEGDNSVAQKFEALSGASNGKKARVGGSGSVVVGGMKFIETETALAFYGRAGVGLGYTYMKALQLEGSSLELKQSDLVHVSVELAGGFSAPVGPLAFMLGVTISPVVNLMLQDYGITQGRNGSLDEVALFDDEKKHTFPILTWMFGVETMLRFENLMVGGECAGAPWLRENPSTNEGGLQPPAGLQFRCGGKVVYYF